MVSKKGYIKTLEAVIAIIMIVIISYTLIARPTEIPPDVPLIVKGAHNIITQSIEFNETIRASLTEDKLEEKGDEIIALQGDIKSIIDRYVPLGYDYTCMICSKPGECLTSTPLDKSVYMTDILVASSEERSIDERQIVRIVRIWFWKKPTESDKLKVEKKIESGDCYYNNACLLKIEGGTDGILIKFEDGGEKECGSFKTCYLC